MSKFTKIPDTKKPTNLQSKISKSPINKDKTRINPSSLNSNKKDERQYKASVEVAKSQISVKSDQIISEITTILSKNDKGENILNESSRIFSQYKIFTDVNKFITSIIRKEPYSLTDIEKELLQYEEIWKIILLHFNIKHIQMKEKNLELINNMFLLFQKSLTSIKLSFHNILSIYSSYLDLIIKENQNSVKHFQIMKMQNIPFETFKLNLPETGKVSIDKFFLHSILFKRDDTSSLIKESSSNFSIEPIVEKVRKSVSHKEKFDFTNKTVELSTNFKHLIPNPFTFFDNSNKAVKGDTDMKFLGSGSYKITDPDSEIVKKITFDDAKINKIPIVTHKLNHQNQKLNSPRQTFGSVRSNSIYREKEREREGKESLSIYEEPLDMDNLGEESKKRALEESKDKVFNLTDNKSRRSASLDASISYSGKVNIPFPEDLIEGSLARNKERIISSIKNSPVKGELIN